jgi:hypothetical protein
MLLLAERVVMGTIFIRWTEIQKRRAATGRKEGKRA